MKQTLMDFGLKLKIISIYYDNIIAINLIKNLIQYSGIKHIEIKHNFIYDHAWKGGVTLEFMIIEKQISDIFMKSLCKDRFYTFQLELGMDNPF